MLQYASSNNMLVDYIVKEHQGDLDLHVSEGQCAYLQLHDGREGFIPPGNHMIRMQRRDRHSCRHEEIRMYWFNLSNQIELQLSDTVTVMEQLLKTVDPELKLYAPIDVNVITDLTVHITDPQKLLRILMAHQAHDCRPVLDSARLSAFLVQKLHYILEDAVNNCKQQASIGIPRISGLTESLEVAMISDICNLLESLSLELVAARITRISPTANSLHKFREKETETLTWYNQVQMDHFSKGSRRTRKKSSTKSDVQTVCQDNNIPIIASFERTLQGHSFPSDHSMKKDELTADRLQTFLSRVS